MNLGTYYNSNEVIFMLEYSRVMAKLLQSAAEQRQAVLKLRKEGKRNRRMDREGQEQRLPERDSRTVGII